MPTPPNTCPIHDLGYDYAGNLCFSMKLVNGLNLHDVHPVADRLGRFQIDELASEKGFPTSMKSNPTKRLPVEVRFMPIPQ